MTFNSLIIAATLAIGFLLKVRRLANHTGKNKLSVLDNKRLYSLRVIPETPTSLAGEFRDRELTLGADEPRQKMPNVPALRLTPSAEWLLALAGCIRLQRTLQKDVEKSSYRC
jgi:hypothetical protein